MDARYEVINFRAENTVIDAPHGIILFLPNGNHVELKYRRSDDEVSLSTSDGRLARMTKYDDERFADLFAFAANAHNTLKKIGSNHV